MAATTGNRVEQRTFPGQSVSPGVVVGPVVLRSGGLDEVDDRRLRDDEVDAEFDRLDSVARAARVSLVRQREALADQFTEEQRKVFDTHLLMLEDPVIEADVRERIAKQRMTCESAVTDVLHVYERLFEVVESESLRNKISDMRDVALRMLRHCKRSESVRPESASLKGSVLVVRELTLSDLTEALEYGVSAIVAEGGSGTSHGAILTRAAGIPAVIAADGFVEALRGGERVLVDGDGGEVVVEPSEERVLAARNQAVELSGPTLSQPQLAGGELLRLSAAAASPSEVRLAARLGIDTVGLYRTELPLIQRHGAPREVSVATLYQQVVAAARSVVFRLPDLDANSELRQLFPIEESNPALGLRGCRMLFAHPEVLRLQLRAILRASEGRDVRIAVPFVTSVGDLKRVQEVAEACREELRLSGAQVNQPPRIGAVIETPAAALLARELLRESDFALLAVDALASSLLAADRAHPSEEVAGLLQGVPEVLRRAVAKLVQVAEAYDVELIGYGEMLSSDALLAALLEAGLRSFAVRPSLLAPMHERLDGARI